MGERHRAAPRRVWDALTSTDQGFYHLQGAGNLRAVQILLGHAKIENTVRYLGVDVEDALTLSEGIEV